MSNLQVGDYCIYAFTSDKENEAIVSLVKIVEVRDHCCIVKVLKNYYDTSFGAYRYLAEKKFDTGASKEYLINITDAIVECDSDYITDAINKFFGCDAMYFGVDSYGIGKDIIREHCLWFLRQISKAIYKAFNGDVNGK